MKNIQSKTVVFLTGAFVSHHCRDEWRMYFEVKDTALLRLPGRIKKMQIKY